MTAGQILLLYLLLVNIVALMLYGIDKWKAKRGAWRIPEATLLIVAAIGGSIGALVGMWLFRHKTKHLKFTLGVPLILLLQIALVYFIFLKK